MLCGLFSSCGKLGGYSIVVVGELFIGFRGGLDGKESACHVDGFDSWVGKFPWRRDRLPTPVFLGFPGGLDGKESTFNDDGFDP